ncbi:MAG TPA: Rrf2 family transcriptional regulator [Ilumatobacter sp.]|nr:Rrf2 family transcriptional regulator [Ilumatobacter sp.]
MRLNQGVEWALHGCVDLAWLPEGTTVPIGRLAEYHDLPAAYLNKQFQALARNGVVVSRAGPRGGFALARPAAEITVLDVVDAIEGREPVFRCLEIRQRGPFPASPQACQVPCEITSVMRGAEVAWRAELTATTVATIADDVARAHPTVPTRVRDWFLA